MDLTLSHRSSSFVATDDHEARSHTPPRIIDQHASESAEYSGPLHIQVEPDPAEQPSEVLASSLPTESTRKWRGLHETQGQEPPSSAVFEMPALELDLDAILKEHMATADAS
eukprot:m.158345 g.158345  ORF g.158345 m.158345 type:complete len:112 (-) comp52989_c0_seq3:7-342(-)